MHTLNDLIDGDAQWLIPVSPSPKGRSIIRTGSIISSMYGSRTVADLGLYPIYAGRKALIDGAGLKNVTAWGDRVGARPGVQKGMRLES